MALLAVPCALGFSVAALIVVAQVDAIRGRLRHGRNEGWRRWARFLLLVGVFDASFADSQRPVIRERRRRK